MNASIIFLACAIGLTGCTMIGPYPHAGSKDREVSRNYPGHKSEYQSTTKDGSTRDPYKPKPYGFTETDRAEALKKLEDILDMEISYVVGSAHNSPETWHYVTTSGARKSQAQVDATCNGKLSRHVGAVGSDPKCWCKWSGADGDGANEQPHIPCRVIPHRR